MTATKLSQFGGMIPAVDSLLLPQNAAEFSRDIWVATGDLEGFWQPTLLYTAASPNTRRVFRIPTNYYSKEHLEDAFFMEFTDQNTDVVHAPMADDDFDRYYWVAPTIVPSYNTHDRILSSLPAYKLGIPTPPTAPTIELAANEGLTASASTYGMTGHAALMWIGRNDGTIDQDAGDIGDAPPLAFLPGGTSLLVETRAYVYTWVSSYGEEGPPSPATIMTGGQLTNWRITLTPPTTSDTDNRTLNSINIYRTISGLDGSVNYYLVDNVPLNTTLYVDSKHDIDIVGGQVLQSASWTPPPSDMEGWIYAANGMIVGWRLNELWFCEPYRPHAWPVAYTQLTQHPIVGIGIVNNTIIVATVSEPYACSGANPGAMKMTKIEAIEPCLSRASIVPTPDGLIYASPNGLVIASPMYGVVKNITDKLITKDQWLEMFSISRLCAARIGDRYLGFGTITDGVFQTNAFQTNAFQQQDFTDSQNGLMIATNDQRVALTTLTADNPTSSVQNDIWTGEVIMQQGQNFVWLNQSQQSTRRVGLWRSKKFQLNNKDNLGAMRVWFTIPANVPPPYLPRKTGLDMVMDDQMYGLVRVYSRGKLRMARELRTPGELWKMPSGFKNEIWQVEVESRVFIKNVQLAASPQELASV